MKSPKAGYLKDIPAGRDWSESMVQGKKRVGRGQWRLSTKIAEAAALAHGPVKTAH